MAEVPIFGKLITRNSAEKPSIFFSNSGSTASGVTSRPVKPVPPVVMTTSIIGSAIQAFTRARMASMSSCTMLRCDVMPGRHDALHQERPGFVVLDVARVGDRQHRDLERHELLGLVDPGHGYTFTQHASRQCGEPGAYRTPARAGMS